MTKQKNAVELVPHINKRIANITRKKLITMKFAGYMIRKVILIIQDIKGRVGGNMFTVWTKADTAIVIILLLIIMAFGAGIWELGKYIYAHLVIKWI